MALQIKIEATGLDKIDQAVKKLNGSFKELKNTLKNIESSTIDDMSKKLPKTADNLIKMDREARKVQNSTYQMGQKIQETGRRMDYLGSKMLPVSIALGAFITGAIKAGIAFESSFAGITKTIDMSAFETEQLRGKMIDLSKTIPVSVNELNKIGELGGQLGISSKNIVSFTDTIAKLGVATNLTAEEGSMMLAQFMNVMKLDDSNIGTLGSTIVRLGNNFATTEKDITSMASRLSATTSVMGISAADTLGFSTAMSSLGISAEEGGSALGRVMIKFNDYASDGGKAAAKLGKVAGMTGDAFSKLWKADQAKAMQKVINGLGKMKENGEDILPVVEELGIKNTRDRNTLLKLASGYRTLNDAMETSNDEWGSTAALSKEAGNRFATLESQIQLLKNNVIALAIKMYDDLRPTLTSIVKNINGFVDSLKDINPKILTGIVTFASVIATVGPALKIANIPMQLFGGLLKKVGAQGETASGIFKVITPRVTAFAGAIKSGITTSGSFATKLGAIGTNLSALISPAGAAVAAFAAIGLGIYSMYKKVTAEQKKFEGFAEQGRQKFEDIMSGYNEATQTNIDAMTTAFVDFGTNLQLASIGSNMFNEEDFTKSFNSGLDKMKVSFNDTMQSIIKSKTENINKSRYLDEQSKNDYIKTVTSEYEGHQEEADKIFKKITGIKDKAAKEGRDLTKTEIDTIKGYYNELQDLVQNLDLTPKTEGEKLKEQLNLGRELSDEQKDTVSQSIVDDYYTQLGLLTDAKKKYASDSNHTSAQIKKNDEKFNKDSLKLIQDVNKQTAELYGLKAADIETVGGKIYATQSQDSARTVKMLKAMGVEIETIPQGFTKAWGKNTEEALKLYREGTKKGLSSGELTQYVNSGMSLLKTNLNGQWSGAAEEATKFYNEGAKKNLMGQDLVDYVNQKLAEMPAKSQEPATQAGNKMGTSVATGVTLVDFAGQIGTWLYNAWNTVTLATSLIWNKGKQMVADLWQGFVDYDFLGKLNTWITNSINNMVLPIKEAWNKGKTTVSNLWKAFTDYNLLGKINTWILNTITRMTLPIKQAWDKGKTTIYNLWKGIREYDLLGKINNWISSKVASITIPFTSLWKKGQKMISNMWNGFKEYDLLGKINKWISNKISNISIPSFDLIQIGKDIIGGIAKGITNFDLKDTIDGLLSKIPIWAQKLLDIHSPSRVMADEVGYWIPAGVAQGMTQNMGTLKDTSQQLATKTEAYMKSSFSNMQLEDLNNALDIQPNLTRNDKDKLRAYYKDLVNEIETQQLIIDTKFNKDVSTNLQTSKQPNSLSNGGVSTDKSVNVDTVNITTNKLDRKELELELKKLSKESGK